MKNVFFVCKILLKKIPFYENCKTEGTNLID